MYQYSDNIKLMVNGQGFVDIRESVLDFIYKMRATHRNIEIPFFPLFDERERKIFYHTFTAFEHYVRLTNCRVEIVVYRDDETEDLQFAAYHELEADSQYVISQLIDAANDYDISTLTNPTIFPHPNADITDVGTLIHERAERVERGIDDQFFIPDEVDDDNENATADAFSEREQARQRGAEIMAEIKEKSSTVQMSAEQAENRLWEMLSEEQEGKEIDENEYKAVREVLRIDDLYDNEDFGSDVDEDEDDVEVSNPFLDMLSNAKSSSSAPKFDDLSLEDLNKFLQQYSNRH